MACAGLTPAFPVDSLAMVRLTKLKAAFGLDTLGTRW